MHDLVPTLIDAVGRTGLAQLPHPLAAALGLYIRMTYPPRWRLAFWCCLAAMFAGVGAAGFRWGKPGLPLLLSVIVEDPYLFRPIPRLIELGTADHVLELSFGALFLCAAGATAL